MLNNRFHHTLQPVYFPELNRRKSLEKYLSYYYGFNCKHGIEPSSVTLTHIDRIHDVGQYHPELLISHVYACLYR